MPYDQQIRSGQAEFQLGKKSARLLAGTYEDGLMNIGGVDGARTRDPRRDRPVF